MTESQLLEAILQLPEGDRLDLLDRLMQALIHDFGKEANHFQRHVLLQRYVLLQDPDCLAGLNSTELTTLAHSQLTSDQQVELSELLSRNCQEINSLSSDEQMRLDEILTEIDQLNLLKAKALYTLQRLQSIAVV
ncbi:MAG: hypothetical protein EA001_13010 [Oscillatoriales cyanobacterium]|nr:MAG: hypothetical protein EA001_13010 [Oscillatoriales cyanobacterium]